MEWCKFFASLPFDIRVQAAEDAVHGAGWVLSQSIAYLTLAESDGFIPASQARRFAAPDIDGAIKALVSEDIFRPRDNGYDIDPDLWNEERNLSDSAERKKQRDRERMRAVRAAAREGREAEEESRDSRATGRATSRATGRATVVTQRRGDKYPPNPPHSGGNESACTKHQRPRRGCAACAEPPPPPVPDWCGSCSNPTTRRIEEADTGRDLGPCPICHPSVVRTQ